MNNRLLSYWWSACAAVLCKAQYLSSVIIVSVSLYLSMNAAVGCMDNSFHADPCSPYDYKNYHYVECSCRCERYSQLYTRGKCGGCHHYRVPGDSKLGIRTSAPSKTSQCRSLTKAR